MIKDFFESMNFKRWLFLLLTVILITSVGLILLRRDMIAAGQYCDDLPAVSVQQQTDENEVQPKQDNQSVKQVNINTADLYELMTLPGIGEGLARRMIEYREKTPFKVPRDIKKVSGIGDKIFKSICDMITVEDSVLN